MDKFRGTWSNKVAIRKDILESQLLAAIQNEVLRPEVIDYALRTFAEKLVMRGVTSQIDSLEPKRRKLAKEIDNLTDFVADGKGSSAIRSKLADRERQLHSIVEQITASKPQSVKIKIRDTRTFVESSLRNIPRLLNLDAQSAKAVIARHMPKSVMTPPMKADGRRIYEVVSEWQLINGGVEQVDGAEGQS